MTTQEAIRLLELSPPFSRADLKKAYRDALMVWHPDRFAGNDELRAKAEARTYHINQAFDILSQLSDSGYPFCAPRETAQKHGAPPPAETSASTNPFPHQPAAASPSVGRTILAVIVSAVMLLLFTVVMVSLGYERNGGTIPNVVFWLIAFAVFRWIRSGGGGESARSQFFWALPKILAFVILGLIVAAVVHSINNPSRSDARVPIPALTPTSPKLETPLTVAAPLGGVKKTNGGTLLTDSSTLTQRQAEQLAALSDRDAQFQLGMAFATGRGRPLDLEQAAFWFKKAANSGHAGAKTQLEALEAQNVDVREMPLSSFETAAESGDARAQLELGQRYMSMTIEGSKTKAVEWYLKAAAQGHAEAQWTLGNCYRDGLGAREDPALAVKWYRMAADQGHAKAQNDLGWCYMSEFGVPRDQSEAARWYRKAATQGNMEAQASLGNIYAWGSGVARDLVSSVQWYTKAAEQGNADAQCALGDIHFHHPYYGVGDDILRDVAKALEWYTKAAEQGDADAQCRLGQIYVMGEDVPKDVAKALEWYTKAAEQGDAEAQCALGEIYYNGDGVAQDLRAAMRWYEKASAQKHGPSHFALGRMYFRGEGGEKNYIEAYKQLSLALTVPLGKAPLNKSETKQAKSAIRLLEEQMTTDQIATAQALARDFKPAPNP